MRMAKEYEELCIFQYNEIKPFINLKASREPEFKKLVNDAFAKEPEYKRLFDEAWTRGPSSTTRPILTSGRRVSSTSSPLNSPVGALSVSPALVQSPAESPDLNQLKHDPSLTPFLKFFLHLKVVEQNWRAISRNWLQYVSIFQRNLFTEKAFAKAILEDAVRTTNQTKFIPQTVLIQRFRLEAANLKDMPISKIVTDALLELAESGVVEFTMDNEYRGDTFGPRILMDVMDT